MACPSKRADATKGIKCFLIYLVVNIGRSNLLGKQKEIAGETLWFVPVFEGSVDSTGENILQSAVSVGLSISLAAFKVISFF